MKGDGAVPEAPEHDLVMDFTSLNPMSPRRTDTRVEAHGSYPYDITPHTSRLFPICPSIKALVRGA